MVFDEIWDKFGLAIRQETDECLQDMHQRLGAEGYLYKPFHNWFRIQVCKRLFSVVAKDDGSVCSGSDIYYDVLWARYGSRPGILWKDKEKYYWKLGKMRFSFYKNHGGIRYGCLLNKEWKSSDMLGRWLFQNELLPRGCSPEMIVEALLFFNKHLGTIDDEFGKLTAVYDELFPKALIIRQIMAVTQSYISEKHG